MTIITLMTDFGLKDGNVGVMKGVIAGIAPQAQVVDLSHLIGPQNIAEAALILLRSAPYFPPGTIHVVVVDPGVGTSRLPMAARLGKQFYVGPDNGTITLLLERLESQEQPTAFYHLDRSQYWLAQVSHVFHGRDIFAPVAAHLAGGAPIETLGDPLPAPVRLQLPRPQRIANGWNAEVIHIDHFGNIATNLRSEHLQGTREIVVSLRGVKIRGLVDTFGERPPGTLINLFGSTGNLIISLVNGSAAQRLGALPGDPVEVVTTGVHRQ
jgi:S-adenosyl-L-methionine hydrolase (adenosine-forming)